jgi:hypothetical protein
MGNSGDRNKILSYKDLLVCQKSMEIVAQVYRITRELPAAEQWGLVSQMRRAAVSVPSNMAEGYGRQATGEYRHHLYDQSGFTIGVGNSSSVM